MTQEDKELLLKDLCARLPYGVKILHEGWNYEWDDELSTVERVVGIDDEFIYTKVIDTHNGEEYRDDKWPIETFDDKLFLRPMSNMTEEEKEDWCSKFSMPLGAGANATSFKVYNYVVADFGYSKDVYLNEIGDMISWLSSHHFDYRGLIEKGLALEAPEGMYK